MRRRTFLALAASSTAFSLPSWAFSYSTDLLVIYDDKPPAIEASSFLQINPMQDLLGAKNSLSAALSGFRADVLCRLSSANLILAYELFRENHLVIKSQTFDAKEKINTIFLRRANA